MTYLASIFNLGRLAVELAEAEARLRVLCSDSQPSVFNEVDRRVGIGMTRLDAIRSVEHDLVLGRWIADHTGD